MIPDAVLTGEEAKAWDDYSIKQVGVQSTLLMGWAAKSVASALYDLKLIDQQKKILVLIGSGNNGGDGLALAWLLLTEYNCPVHICCAQKPKTPDATYFFELIKNVPLSDESKIHFILSSDIKGLDPDIIIDAMLGIGFKGELKQEIQNIIAISNSLSSLRVAIDISSGIDASGQSFEHDVFKAHHTLAIGCHKVGSLIEPGCFSSGKNQVVPIGFAPYTFPNRRTAWKSQQPMLRKPRGHKYSSGSAVFYGGSYGMEGALILAVRAFIQLGGGLAKVSCDSPGFKKDIIQLLPESQVLVEKNAAAGFLTSFCDSRTHLGVLGMGLDHDPGREFWEKIFEAKGKVLIVDGGGLRFMANYLDLVRQHKLEALVLTPHKGEWQDLLSKESKNIFEDLSSFAHQNSCFVIAKGYGMFITNRHNVARFFLQQEFSLATAGTGDILNGVLANFLLRGSDPLMALEQACLAYLSAAKTARGANMETLLPSDLIQALKDGHDAVL